MRGGSLRCVEGCTCGRHSRSFWADRIRGPKNGRWVQGPGTWKAAHSRVNAARGKPAHCEHCGITEDVDITGRGHHRFEWALDHAHSTENFRTDGRRTWSLDEMDYIRLCVPCHRIMDFTKMRDDRLRRQEVHHGT